LLELALLGKERIRNVKCEFKSFNPVHFMDKLVSILINKSAYS
jgi:hypothetical protein